MSPVFEYLTHWSQDEWLGKPFASLVHPDDLSPNREPGQNTLAGLPTKPAHVRILSKLGGYLRMEIVAKPLWGKQTAEVPESVKQSLVEDITIESERE